MRKLPVQQRPTRKLLGAIIAAALFIPETGYTLGLGEIEVNSALNQKLKADIELLSAVPEDTETIIVKLASRKEFARAGLDRPYLLNDLRFKSVVINGVPYINVSSSSPIREPFLNFLVEIDWPNGHLLREYTVLLDPPVFMTEHNSTAANVTPSGSDNSSFRPGLSGSNSTVPVVTPGTSVSSRPASTAQDQPNTVSQVPSTNQTSWIPAPVIQQQSAINPAAGSYKIKTGDTAWSLADAMRPDQSITVPQMMIAMLRANPESFINENINGLKRGYILRIPDYDQIATISNADAIALVREQAALWRQYQQSQAGGQPVSAMEADDTGASAGMTVDSAASSDDSAYLEIVSAGSGSSATSGKDATEMTAQELRAELALARERVETELVEKEALQQRVDRLQQSVEIMKGMLSIEDAELAEVQSLNIPAGGEPAEEAIGEEAIIDEPVMEDSDVNVIDEDLADMSAEAVLDEAAALDEAEALYEEAELAEEAAAGEDAVFVDEASTEDVSMAEMPEQVAPAIDDFVAAQPQVVDREPADPLTQLLNNPMMLAAAGGGLLLIVALIGLIIKRRKAAETSAPIITSGFDDLESVADDIASEGESTQEVAQGAPAAPAADEESIDDSDTVKEASSAKSDVSAEVDEEGPRDDVIAEADVYLAYGIYQQAEELLTQAIADNPERDDYRVKLAETHYAGKNADAFVEIASDIKQRVDDASPAWKKVLSMGQDLCADNPMFQGTLVGSPDVDSLSPDSPEMDFDLGTDEAASEVADKAPDSDLSLDEESPGLNEQPLEMSELEADAKSIATVDELEFDLSDTGAVEEAMDKEDALSLDIDASELDFGVKSEVEVEGIDLTDDIEESLDLTDIDIGLDEVTDSSNTDDVVAADIVEDVADVDIDFGLDGADTDLEAAVTDEDVAIDLTEEAESLDLGLDLGEDADDEIKIVEAALVDRNDFGDEEDFDLSSLDDVDEISTKLDLARAYHDMGDHEGTKGILEEVLADGDDEQKHEARELMGKLG